MLRVGLTGDLGSGKSTVAALLREHGAVVFSSDEMGRAMMQPGQAVYDAIVRQFGPAVVLRGGGLNRPELARLAFNPEHPRVEELNAIVHPAVIGEQERRVQQIAQRDPDAIVVVESALIFTTQHAGGEEPWRNRFDCIVLVTASEETKIERYVQRTAGTRQLRDDERRRLRTDAAARLKRQKVPATHVDFEIENQGERALLEARVDELWESLQNLRTQRG